MRSITHHHHEEHTMTTSVTTADGRKVDLTAQRLVFVGAIGTKYVMTDSIDHNGVRLAGPTLTKAEWSKVAKAEREAEAARRPHLVRTNEGSYNLVEDGRVTWFLARTKRDDWYDHDPKHPWIAARLFGAGSQVEARFATLAAAKAWLL